MRGAPAPARRTDKPGASRCGHRSEPLSSRPDDGRRPGSSPPWAVRSGACPEGHPAGHGLGQARPPEAATQRRGSRSRSRSAARSPRPTAAAPPQLKTLAHRAQPQRQASTTAGLPVCPTTRSSRPPLRALNACRSALVGKGTFAAEISLRARPPTRPGRSCSSSTAEPGTSPVLFGQIYAPHPFATSFVIVFAVKKLGKGTYGTELPATLPRSLGNWGNLTGLEMTLSKALPLQGREP